MMARNYFKVSGYFGQIVRSSSQGFVTTSQTKTTTFSVRTMKPSKQPVHDETFSRLHALFRSFKTQFKRTFTRINNTYSLSFNIVNVLFKMTDEADIPEAINVFMRHKITSLINISYVFSSLPYSSLENANFFCFVLFLLFQLKKFKMKKIYIYKYIYMHIYIYIYIYIHIYIFA